MPSTKWSDINRDGRRLESIIKAMNTKFHTATNESMKLAYVDRIIKATHEKVEIAKIVLRVDEITKVKPEQLQKKVIDAQLIPVSG